MNKELRVGGFPEWLPPEQVLENKIKGIISHEFSKYGFVNIETPAVERNDVLVAKSGDAVSQQIFGLHGLAQKQRGIEDNKDYSLHFDLTVPMTRYVIDHAEELAFPFKRYQMQKVRRGESHQKGRFKEFYQCDVDVIDEKVDIRYDAETIEVLFKTLQVLFDHLGIDKKLKVQLNNRKVYDTIFDQLSLDIHQRFAVMKALDDYYKLEKNAFLQILTDSIGTEKSNALISYLDFNVDEPSSSEPDAILQAKNELKVVNALLKTKGVNVEVNPYIVRGLDYYTGTVFETVIDGYEEFGSICSGGRYDNLSAHISKSTNSKGKNYEGVGGSIGLSRLLHRLLESGLAKNTERLCDVIIFNLRDNAVAYREKIADVLRGVGLKVDMYYGDEKLVKQFKYADKKGIPVGVFAGEVEANTSRAQIKHLINKETEIATIESIGKDIEKLLK